MLDSRTQSLGTWAHIAATEVKGTQKTAPAWTPGCMQRNFSWSKLQQLWGAAVDPGSEQTHTALQLPSQCSNWHVAPRLAGLPRSLRARQQPGRSKGLVPIPVSRVAPALLTWHLPGCICTHTRVMPHDTKLTTQTGCTMLVAGTACNLDSSCLQWQGTRPIAP